MKENSQQTSFINTLIDEGKLKIRHIVMGTDRERGVKVGQPLPPLMQPVSCLFFFFFFHARTRLSRGATCHRRRASFPVWIGDQPAGLAVAPRATPVPHTPPLSDLSH